MLLRGWTVLGLAKGLGRGGARVIQELSCNHRRQPPSLRPRRKGEGRRVLSASCGGTWRSRSGSGFANAAFGSIKGANLRLPGNATARASSPGKGDADLPQRGEAGCNMPHRPRLASSLPYSCATAGQQASFCADYRHFDFFTKQIVKVVRTYLPFACWFHARASTWASRTGKGEPNGQGRAVRARASVERAFL